MFYSWVFSVAKKQFLGLDDFQFCLIFCVEVLFPSEVHVIVYEYGASEYTAPGII